MEDVQKRRVENPTWRIRLYTSCRIFKALDLMRFVGSLARFYSVFDTDIMNIAVVPEKLKPSP